MFVGNKTRQHHCYGYWITITLISKLKRDNCKKKIIFGGRLQNFNKLFISTELGSGVGRGISLVERR